MKERLLVIVMAAAFAVVLFFLTIKPAIQLILQMSGHCE